MENPVFGRLTVCFKSMGFDSIFRELIPWYRFVGQVVNLAWVVSHRPVSNPAGVGVEQTTGFSRLEWTGGYFCCLADWQRGNSISAFCHQTHPSNVSEEEA
jgi:hypothetical protein